MYEGEMGVGSLYAMLRAVGPRVSASGGFSLRR